jgi:predicted transcriptional regulator
MGSEYGLHFSAREEEIADLLWDIGLMRNSARVLTLMIKDVDLTSREIERVVDLRQPEVSSAITDLMKKRWIHIVLQITENKGRPMKVYHIAKTLNEILDELMDTLIGSYEQKFQDIERVRNLLHQKPVLTKF